jgi:hypothetical protein
MALFDLLFFRVRAKEGFTGVSQFGETIVNHVLLARNIVFSESRVLLYLFTGHTVVVKGLFVSQILEVAVLTCVQGSFAFNLSIGMGVLHVHWVHVWLTSQPLPGCKITHYKIKYILQSIISQTVS